MKSVKISLTETMTENGQSKQICTRIYSRQSQQQQGVDMVTLG